MRTPAASAAILIGLVAIAPVHAAQDPFEVCFQIADGTARLACFDQEMQRRHAAAATSKKLAQDTVGLEGPALTKKLAQENAGLEGAALNKKLKEEGMAPEPIKPIVAAVVRILPRPNSESAFELDNGQTWEMSEVKTDLVIDPHDQVTIKPGALGAFFLTTAKHQRVRVHRTR